MWIEFQSARLSKRGVTFDAAYVTAWRNSSNEVKMNLIKNKIVHVELLLLIFVVMSFTMISGVGATMPNDDIVGDGINVLTIQNDSEQKLLSTNFICIVLTEKQYNAATTPKDGIVRLVIPQDKFVIVQVPSKSEVSIPSDIVNRSKLPNNEKIIVLWVPLPLISYNVVEEDVVLSAPENFFNTYESLSDLLQVAKKDYMNNIEIDQFIPAETYFKEKNLRSWIRYEERRVYNENTGYQINGLTGKLYDATYSNQGNSNFASYHEIEIYLNNNDCIEFISEISDGVTQSLQAYWVLIYDNLSSSYITLLSRQYDDTPYMEYYLYLESGTTYWVHFKNPITNTWYTQSYIDSTPSTSIHQIMPSSELYLTYYSPSLLIQNSIVEDWTRTVSNGLIKPQTTLYEMTYAASYDQYVSVSSNWNTDNGLTSQHSGGTSVS